MYVRARREIFDNKLYEYIQFLSQVCFLSDTIADVTYIYQ